jgi:hypothetical protein
VTNVDVDCCKPCKVVNIDGNYQVQVGYLDNLMHDSKFFQVVRHCGHKVAMNSQSNVIGGQL